MSEAAPIFLIPSPGLGPVADVYPERLRADDIAWIAHTREILRKKQVAARAGTWSGSSGYSSSIASASACG